MAKKPFVYEVFKSLDANNVKEGAENLVKNLVEKGYLVKVVVENYISVWDDKTTHMIYQTTIIASAHENVDIGLRE